MIHQNSRKRIFCFPITLTLSLADWQKMGLERHSVIADPLFVNPANDDYRLRPESPAFKLGFQPIDVAKIGPRQRGS